MKKKLSLLLAILTILSSLTLLPVSAAQNEDNTDPTQPETLTATDAPTGALAEVSADPPTEAPTEAPTDAPGEKAFPVINNVVPSANGVTVSWTAVDGASKYIVYAKKNGEDFAKALADMADVYVSDAFGTVHRAHASTAGVAAFLPAYAGLLVEKEISIMGKALDDPKRPFVAVLGGAKVSDKINVINNLLEKADTVIIGGGMAYTFKKAQGYTIGKSLLEEDKLDYAKEMLAKAEAKGVNFLLPDDNFCASEFSADAEPVLVEGYIPDDLMGMDIGPKTVEKFAAAVKGAGTIVWNGPMGVFEFDRFANGTKAMAQALADSGAVTIVGGGDSAAAVEKLGFADRITHISTGGGASLEFLEGKELPGVACLLDK